jgi:hypothetical protein
MENLKQQLVEKKQLAETVKDVPYLYKNALDEIAGIEEQIANFGKAPAVKVHAKRTSAPKTTGLPLDSDAVKGIMSKYTKNIEKHYQLHLLGYSNQEISQITGAPIPSIARDIWKSKKS